MPSASSSSTSARPSSSSSSSSARPSSSSSSSSGPPPQPTPFISANAWMSFFLFCCLVLIILQGPLGLSGIGSGAVPTNLPSWNGGVGCGGMVAGYVPWCQQLPIQNIQQVQIQQQQGYPQVHPPVVQVPLPFPAPAGLGAGHWLGYNPYRQYIQSLPQRSMQYQRPGLQVQVNQQQRPAPVSIPVPVTVPTGSPQTMLGISNLENAFFPLLVGAIALLVIFDYSS